MKSLFNGLLLASVLAFTVGCGKDGGSTGGTAAAPVQNLYNSALSTTSKSALDRVQAWYNGTQEGASLLNVKVNITRTKYVSNTTPDCKQKEFLGIEFQYCTSSSSSSTGTVVGTLNNVLLSQTSTAIKSKGNQELNAIFSSASGKLMNAVDFSPSVTQLEFLRTDGVVVTYIIDRNLHSLLNPVQKTESSQSSRSDTFVTAQRVY